MDSFEYRNGRLHCEEVQVGRIAEQLGTPVYIYSRDALERSYQNYAQALEGRNALVLLRRKSQLQHRCT